MHTIIHPIKPTASAANRFAVADFRSPNYECRDQADALKLEVFVPGVDASGVEITLRGPDLIVTAMKSHLIRINFRAAHLEAAQKDYRLVLRVGHGFTADGMSAEINGGVLTLALPKRAKATSSSPFAARKVA